MPPSIEPARILDALRSVKYPGFSRDIVSFGLVHDLSVSQEGDVSFRIELMTEKAEVGEAIEQDARRALAALDGLGTVDIHVAVKAPPPRPGTAAPPRPLDLLPEVGRIVAVASGKGGVGKSTVAANLAVALARRGRRVGLLDADVYGPSVPLMFGLEGTQPEVVGQRAQPPERYGVRVMSIGFFLERDAALIWRGPMVMKAVEQLLGDVNWGPLDEMIIDLPPGTGDAQLTLAQKIRMHGSVVVTTPNDLALIDAVKAVTMFRKVEVPVLGIVENMSYFECPHCHERSHVFAQGGARRECERLGLPFLGEIPLHPDIREASDRGRPLVDAEPDSAHARAFLALADAVTEPAASPSPTPKKGSFFQRFRG